MTDSRELKVRADVTCDEGKGCKPFRRPPIQVTDDQIRAILMMTCGYWHVEDQWQGMNSKLGTTKELGKQIREILKGELDET